MNKLILFLCTFLPLLATAQVTESSKVMSQGSNNALTVSLTDISVSDAEKVWKDFAKTFGGKIKYNKKEKEYFVDDASVPSVSTNTIDLYSKAEKVGTEVAYSVWFDLGGGYLSSTSNAAMYSNAVSFMKDFLREVERFKINEQLKIEMKSLEKLNDNLKSLTRDKEGYEKDIKKAEEKITESKAKIEQNIKDQASKQSEINAQQSKIDKIKSDLSKL